MRRKEKQITDQSEMVAILHRAEVCRLAMVDEGRPYIIPLNFGYSNGSLYFHSAWKGRKIDVLKQNPQVCFECDLDVKIVIGKKACEWGAEYKSVIGFGRARFITESEAKKKALNIIMDHYAGRSFDFSDGDVDKVAVIHVEIEEMTGKRSPA